MNVVFVSCTPLAGAPIRIADALNQYTDFQVRLINLSPNWYGERTFPEDLTWGKDKEECVQLISQADILHFHHFMDVESENNPFNFNFKKYAPKAKIIRHFHSDLNFIANNEEQKKLILNDKYPKLVIPHSPERTFLSAFIVPNIIPIHDELLTPLKNNNKIPRVFFSASSSGSMWCERWNTKGLPEVCKKIRELLKKTDFEFKLVQNISYQECMKLKQESDIVIGDTTSGSYHLTDLEALSQGKVTLTYLDGRSQMVLQNLLKCDNLPFINTRLEEIDLPFIEIVQNEKLRKELSKFSREWIEKYYDDKKMVKFFEQAYTKLLNNEPLLRQENLIYSSAKTFLYNDLYNMQWETRKKMNLYKNKKIPKLLGRIMTLFIFDKDKRRNFRNKYVKE